MTVPVDIETAFAGFDLVCASRIVSVTALSPEDATDATGALTPVDYDVLHADAWCYKGAIPSGQFVLRIHQKDRAQGRPVVGGSYYLGYYKTAAGGVLVGDLTIDIPPLAFPAPHPSGSPGAVGLQQLQMDAMAIAQGPDLNLSRAALEFLTRFKHLDPSLQSALLELGNRQDPDTRLLSLIALFNVRGIPNRPALLHRLALLLNAPGMDPDIFPGMFEAESVIGKSTIADFAALKELVKCRYPMIRFAAIEAIREFRAPRTMPFLVELLDSPDVDVRYDALITLAEISGKGGDFEPLDAQFKANPAKYTALWKQWWRDDGSRRYAGVR